MGRDNGNLNTLKPQPGQYDSYNPSFHPLPGQWAKDQLNGQREGRTSQMTDGSRSASKPQTEIQRALAEERAVHKYWEEWQGVSPGKPVYEDPRAFQNTLLPVARYGTDGRGD